jgi:hypothetical protein
MYPPPEPIRYFDVYEFVSRALRMARTKLRATRSRRPSAAANHKRKGSCSMCCLYPKLVDTSSRDPRPPR